MRNASKYVDACIEHAENKAKVPLDEVTQEWLGSFDEITQVALEGLEPTFDKYLGSARSVCQAIADISKANLNVVYELRAVTRSRFLDRSTSKDKREYKWRMQVWDAYRELALSVERRPEETRETLRQAIVNSSMPEALKIDVFSKVRLITNYDNRIRKKVYRRFREYADAGQAYHSFLYHEQDKYRIIEATNRFVFIDEKSREKHDALGRELDIAFYEFKAIFNAYMDGLKVNL